MYGVATAYSTNENPSTDKLNRQSTTLQVTATLGCHGAGFLMRDLSDMSKFRLSHWIQVVPWSMKYLKNIHHSS